MNKTLEYYNTNADSFISNTVEADVNGLRREFLKYIPDGGTILDLGCGSGRDSKAFIKAGYDVVAVDGSEALCKSASELIGQDVICSTFQDYSPNVQFDGIWACATLLHLEKNDIHDVVSKLSRNLNKGGCFYMSFKYGDHSGERNGRFFTDMTKESLIELLEDVTELSLEEDYITSDVRPGRSDEKWLNVIYKRK